MAQGMYMARTEERGSCQWCSVPVQGATLGTGSWITEEWGRYKDCLLLFWQAWLVVEQGVSARVGGEWWEGQGEMVCGIHMRHGWWWGELQLLFYCSAKNYPENWVWGNRSVAGLRVTVLVSWQVNHFLIQMSSRLLQKEMVCVCMCACRLVALLSHTDILFFPQVTQLLGKIEASTSEHTSNLKMVQGDYRHEMNLLEFK